MVVAFYKAVCIHCMHSEYKAFSADYFRFSAFNFFDVAKNPTNIWIIWKKWISKQILLSWQKIFFKVGIFQVVAALYKAFGQTFIYDDHFLSIVGAICSFFNCSGRLIYGFIMDKTSYKMAMSIEAVLLTVLGKYIRMNSAFISNNLIHMIKKLRIHIHDIGIF